MAQKFFNSFIIGLHFPALAAKTGSVHEQYWTWGRNYGTAQRNAIEHFLEPWYQSQAYTLFFSLFFTITNTIILLTTITIIARIALNTP